MEHYNKNIQLHKKVIKNVFNHTKLGMKTLVFGLGFDSKMWFSLNSNTYFIEDNQKYIDINKDIPIENIIKYEYKTKVKHSQNMTDEEIQKFVVPDKLMKLAPFDIIIIDGPNGYNKEKPGRLIPYYWSSVFLSKVGTFVFLDDVKRPLEEYLVEKYFSKNKKKYFKFRKGSCRIKI